jgi:hypothetical protein
MADKPSTEVRVPASEVARQATDALGGYVYQLDHTVMTWLTLGDDEALHIEFAEDIAVSGDGNLDLTQIKKLAANITLRSEGVAKLITSVWEFQPRPAGVGRITDHRRHRKGEAHIFKNSLVHISTFPKHAAI